MAYDPDLISALEPSQLVAATKRPYPRRVLGQGCWRCWSRCAFMS